MPKRIASLSKAVILGSLLTASLPSCAQRIEYPADDPCKVFETARAARDVDVCWQYREQCLAVLDRVTEKKKDELRGLQTRLAIGLGKDNIRDNLLAASIRKMEKEIADLTSKREKAASSDCDKPDTDESSSENSNGEPDDR
jgi:hypothetical protein